MEDIIIRSVIQLGSTGILSAVLYVFAKRFMEETAKQTQETNKQMSARIDSLEKRCTDCEQDRIKIHQQLFDLLASHKFDE